MSMFFPSNWQEVISWLIMLLIFFFVFPRLIFYQIMSKLERGAEEIEGFSKKAQRKVLQRSLKLGGERKESKKIIERFMDFFMIPPVDLDPYGILKKIEYLIDASEDRFAAITSKLAKKADPETRADVSMGLKVAVSLNAIAKLIRHYVETVKKFGNFQIAMLIQMQLPIIRKLAQAHLDGTDAFLKGEPVGDSIGPLVAASLIDGETKEIAKDIIVGEKSIGGRRVFILKSKGPGGRIGKIGDAVLKLTKKHKIARIITIDASLKLEGEKTGKVSEGVGVAIGPIGAPAKAKIEEIATSKGIELEAVAIKMDTFEAIQPMHRDIVRGLENAQEAVITSVKGTKKGANVIVVGVGNTVGIGNNKRAIGEVVKKIRKRRKKEEEKPWWKK